MTGSAERAILFAESDEWFPEPGERVRVVAGPGCLVGLEASFVEVADAGLHRDYVVELESGTRVLCDELETAEEPGDTDPSRWP